MTDDIEAAAALLREKGWTVLPPDELPPVEVGQVWESPKAGIKSREVYMIGRHFMWPWVGGRMIHFRTSIDRGRLTEDSFVAWVRKANARPMP